MCHNSDLVHSSIRQTAVLHNSLLTQLHRETGIHDGNVIFPASGLLESCHMLLLLREGHQNRNQHLIGSQAGLPVATEELSIHEETAPAFYMVGCDMEVSWRVQNKI